MATTKPLTNEAIALTEKKMDMTLDDIIKMSKKPAPKVKKQRVPNKSQNFSNGGSAAAARGNPARGNPVKVRQFMDSRSSLRQGALAQRRSNFQANHFPLATEVARKAAAAPTGNRPFNRSRPANWNKPRVGAPPVQRNFEGSFGGKQQRQHLQAKMVPKQRPQTLDSLFANMKEQRMKVQFQQQNNARRGGVAPQQQQQQQQQQRGGRGRGWFGNFAN